MGTPAVTVEGAAANVAIAGATGAGTVVMVICRLEVPAALVQSIVNTVLADRVTVVAIPGVTAPTPLSIEHVGAGIGALPYVQLQVTLVGLPVTTALGLTENEPITGRTGWTTVTVTVLVDSPASLVQRRVKVVSAVSVRVDCAPSETAPTPSIEHSGAGLGVPSNPNDHVKVAATPLITEDGDAEKADSDGATGGGGGGGPQETRAAQSASPARELNLAVRMPAGYRASLAPSPGLPHVRGG